MEQTRFSQDSDHLMKALRERIDGYFIEKGMKKTGNASLYLKSIFMLSLWLVPYILSFVLGISLWWCLLALAVLAGIGMAGVGMTIMHDANHGTFHHKKSVNELVANLMFLLPAHPYNWKNQHNIAHHTHTNIDGHDEDVESGGLLRLTKEQEWKSVHQYQFLYAPFLYAMTTLMRAVVWEFTRLDRHFKEHPNISLSKRRKEWTTLISLRIVYFLFWIGVPIFFGVNEWYFPLVFFLVMHLVCGLFLTIVFQTAHAVPKAQTFSGTEERHSWVVHQLVTTCNFATSSRFACWFLGGLNFQKEHHLFPNISHVHYPAISPILRGSCKERGIVYIEYKSFFGAVGAHFQLLYTLGRKPI